MHITRRVIEHLESITGLLLVETERRNEFRETQHQPQEPREVVMEREKDVERRMARWLQANPALLL